MVRWVCNVRPKDNMRKSLKNRRLIWFCHQALGLVNVKSSWLAVIKQEGDLKNSLK